MNEYFSQLLERFRELWGRLTPLQKGLVTGIPAVGFLVLAFLVAALSRAPQSYGTLFSDLPREDAAQIVSRLKASGMPYQLKDDGLTILIPLEEVYETRLGLAREGLPKGPGVGFELFDKSQFLGMTDAQQRVAYQRALEGELTRTVMSLMQVRMARVNLALPKPSLYSEMQRDPTASVLVEVKRGHRLDGESIRGIIHLVAMGVEGLKPENVKVVDNHGNVLSDAVRDDLMDEKGAGGMGNLSRQAKVTAGQLRVLAAVEQKMESRLEEILNKVLGPGRAAVKVSAEIDFDQAKLTSKTYEPALGTKGVMRSESDKEEKYSGVGGIPGGVPGVDSNIPGYQAVVGGNLAYDKKERLKNYEVNEKIEEIMRAPGTIKRLNVAVFVDGVQPQQHAAIQRAVSAAAGVDLARGDVIAVENMPFDKTLATETAIERAQVARKEKEQVWLDVAKFASVFVLVLLTLIFVMALVKPRVVQERVLVEVAGAGEGPPEPEMAAPPPPPPPPPPEEVAPPPPLLIEPEPTAALERQRRAQIRTHVTRMARQRPELIAQIIKRWLLEEKR